ncbi:zinc-dependent alcohol dehydrogenase family protein [Streptomyces liangshanensis]|uniref:enoyl-[acyl-carrier-protein] reductase n=1 Tax=Streptomyces liangshanensis TaxID=2717324 RepID=A0A6G9GUG5_9ACTN|nr:zinc-dependent alcohol dehydrogenase family protein [Streptomyces liangshanensis]QIQ01898.1 zinc-dependent alcohol dehydrogenase family protein [Streptomyces liangshanensis]
MKAVQIAAFGSPADVLTVTDLPDPPRPVGDEVVVAVEYSPVNMHDLAFVGGLFFEPPLPAIPGNEGVGRVVATGPDVTGVATGDRVVLPLLSGAWRERVTVPAAGLTALPDGDVRQYAMLASNPPTAGLILDEFVPLRPGDWVAQNAANGGVGRALIAFARARGVRTVNLVRRPEAVAELKAAGADVVVVDGPDAADEIRSLIGDAQVRLAAAAVGGPAASTLLRVLAPGATVVDYGSYGIAVDPRDAEVTERGITVTKFFVGAFDRATKLVPLVDEAVRLVESGALTQPVAAVYPLAEAREAAAHTLRGGKVLLRVAEEQGGASGNAGS